MGNDFYSGSDEVMGAGELKYAQTATFDAPMSLENGGQLPNLTVVYETYGKLSPAKDNAILICHALTGDSHTAAHNEDDDPGWWDIVVGPQKPIDTDKFFVICPNILGGCRGTTGPNSVNPSTGRVWGRDFPSITIGDMVEAQNRLIEHLGIEQLLGVVGGSMGGHQAMSWGVKFPDKVRGVVLLGTSSRLSTQALAFDIVGRNAIRHDPNFNGGEFYDGGARPITGLAIARMLGHITYLSPEAMSEKFEDTRDQPRNLATRFEKDFSVGSYLAYKGLKFTERFDANSYLTISMAMDQFNFGGDIEQLTQTFAGSKSRWLTVSYTSDWLFPPEQSIQIVTALLHSSKPVSYCNVRSNCGHDAFLLEDDINSYGELMRGFFLNLLSDEVSVEPAPVKHSPTSIFHHSRRMDYELITELIPSDASVLDLGCGYGGLLQTLKERGNTLLRGVELTEDNIIACVRSGLDVVHEDLNSGLSFFSDNQFDFVVLSRTLQAVQNVELVVDEMLRVGKQCIISVPNFAYYKLVDMLVKTGRTPEADLLHYKWYNTPNIRCVTLDDFTDFCNAKNITIHEKIALDTESNRKISDKDDPNRNADMAIFVISR